MIFPEDKLKLASKMLEAAWDSCPSEAAAAGLHWMAAATMIQVIICYGEGGENDAACDNGAG